MRSSSARSRSSVGWWSESFLRRRAMCPADTPETRFRISGASVVTRELARFVAGSAQGALGEVERVLGGRLVLLALRAHAQDDERRAGGRAGGGGDDRAH